jgi:hypothetical protein
MKHGIMEPTDLEQLANEQELIDRYAARWDSQAAPYDPAVSAEERWRYRSVPLPAFAAVVLVCVALLVAWYV